MTIGQNVGYSPGVVEMSTKSPERCKPDYEAIIKKLNHECCEIQKAIEGLLQAHQAEFYIPGELTLSQAVGFLHLKNHDCLTAIEKIMAEQEKEQ
jgi:hypothetical protein